MNLKLDENLGQRIARQLADVGHDVTTVAGEGLSGSPDEVVQEVQQHLRHFAPGGGLIFASVHNIQANVPPENVIAMFDTARRFQV